MATLAGGEVRDHELEVVAAAEQHEPALRRRVDGVAPATSSTVRRGRIDAVAGDQAGAAWSSLPVPDRDVERHRHGGDDSRHL